MWGSNNGDSMPNYMAPYLESINNLSRLNESVMNWYGMWFKLCTQPFYINQK